LLAVMSDDHHIEADGRYDSYGFPIAILNALFILICCLLGLEKHSLSS
jgi:hypothetical protein